MEVRLKDGSKFEVLKGESAYDIAKRISEGLARNAVCARVDGKLVDLDMKIEKECDFEIVTTKDKDALIVLRHSTAHVLAEAVKELYPTCKIAIGPANEDGFFYEFDFQNNISEADLEKIENQMKKIIKADEKFSHAVVTRAQALKKMKELQEKYKVELIEAIPEGETITMYSQGNFVDVCRGPHIPRTGMIKAFKLTRIAGAYWKGDEKNKMLTRVYGTAFFSKADLDAYFEMIEEAKKRDHRKIGRELGLFFIDEHAPGMPFYMPNGVTIRNELIKYWREMHKKAGYVEIETPMAMNRKLWEISGHWDHYKENMYTFKVEDEDFAIKPMNCPGGMIYYKENIHSYREFPLRVGELGKVHRHESSGTLHGLFRVRCFTQDDAHIFMLPSQIENEIKNVLTLVEEMYKAFGLTYHLELSTMPENHIGDVKDWELAETSLKNALKKIGKDFVINEGDGAFYGPKIDIHIKDAIGRTWQCGTIQLDMQLPKRFNLEYVAEDGTKKEPIMIHRVIYGSIDRFLGIITENFAGAFPVWLAPVQVKVMNVSEKSEAFVDEVYNKLFDEGIRVEKDVRGEKIGYKIREAVSQKIPYMIIIGEQEAQNKNVSVRKRGTNETVTMSVDEFMKLIKKDIKTKVIW